VPIEDPAALRTKGVLYVLADSSPLSFYSPRAGRPPPARAARADTRRLPSTSIPDRGLAARRRRLFDLADAFYAPCSTAIRACAAPARASRIWRLNP